MLVNGVHWCSDRLQQKSLVALKRELSSKTWPSWGWWRPGTVGRLGGTWGLSWLGRPSLEGARGLSWQGVWSLVGTWGLSWGGLRSLEGILGLSWQGVWSLERTWGLPWEVLTLPLPTLMPLLAEDCGLGADLWREHVWFTSNPTCLGFGIAKLDCAWTYIKISLL